MDGFIGNGKNCIDIDECSQYEKPNDYLCNGTGICINTIGYYRCDCLQGFTQLNNSNTCFGKNIFYIKHCKNRLKNKNVRYR